MSSAWIFGYTLKKCGKNANFSKFDLCDAYKNVRSFESDFRLQGFTWLGKFFYKNRQICGAKSAVPNFDTLGNTLECIAIALSSIPDDLVHRQLDDVPSVSPEGKDWGENFNKCYVDLCTEVGIKLAPNCKKNEKAFENVTRGKVFFDSILMGVEPSGRQKKKGNQFSHWVS